ncbi:MAG: 5-amino-6-(5-phosphoribosylamino)uracil reductase [Asgard group archaeon]|nr:5-amino-6-(5-phosphoribosylamino)uracil reductase [Asgard group archaeon]
MKVIMHNSVSLDMSMKYLNVDLKTHYSIVEKFKPDIYLFGSSTALEAINDPRPETPDDFIKPVKKGPYWAIVDSKGRLENLLHNFRQSNLVGNLIILISDKTPKVYIDYLKKRDYYFLITGKDFVDYKEAFKLLEIMYNAKTIVVDSGGKLNHYLIKNNLVDEISLVITPEILGKDNCINLFREVNNQVRLELLQYKKVNDYLWVTYKIIYS